MSGSYAYNANLWPVLITLALLIFLGWYSWHRRNVPGAKPFIIGCTFSTLWALGSLLEVSAVDLPAKVFWAKYQIVWQIPTITALMCFVLVYAGLGRWLTRRSLILLSVPPVLFLVLIVTNDYHHLVWIGSQMTSHTILLPGMANRIFLGYAYMLGLVNFIVLIWLAIRSPQHRWPVILMLFGQITGRILYLLNYIYSGLLGPEVSILFVVGLIAVMYAIALFRFHVFDPIPLARSVVIEQMNEGMLVLDMEGKIVDLNPAAEKILGEPPANIQGRHAAEVLQVTPDLLLQSFKIGRMPFDISLGHDQELRYFSLNLTPLVDRSKLTLGWLLLLHEETEQRRAHLQLLEQQQVVATLQERDRLARELHDGIGQVLGYASMQIQTITNLVLSGNPDQARTGLNRLRDIVKDAHADVRESILNLKSGPAEKWSFLPSLKQYLNSFQVNYGIHTEIGLPPELNENTFEPAAGVQILRVIQEALTNARKHSNAHNVKVIFEVHDRRASVTISDDGCGFIPDQRQLETGHFGLGFMRERMNQIGGSIIINSRPGDGTVVKLEAPLRN